MKSSQDVSWTNWASGEPQEGDVAQGVISQGHKWRVGDDGDVNDPKGSAHVLCEIHGKNYVFVAIVQHLFHGG